MLCQVGEKVLLFLLKKGGVTCSVRLTLVLSLHSSTSM